MSINREVLARKLHAAACNWPNGGDSSWWIDISAISRDDWRRVAEEAIRLCAPDEVAPAPKPQADLLHLQIAVAVAQDGSWEARGSSNYSYETGLLYCMNKLPYLADAPLRAGMRITADVPLPQATEVAGTVEAPRHD